MVSLSGPWCTALAAAGRKNSIKCKANVMALRMLMFNRMILQDGIDKTVRVY